MNVRNCRKCGKIFNYVIGAFICPECKDKQEEDFQRVKEYVRENRGATINQVADECDVDKSQIHQWLREERLELTEGSGITLSCEVCGASINTGRFCNKCRRDLTNDLVKAASAGIQQESTAVKATRERDKMRFLSK